MKKLLKGLQLFLLLVFILGKIYLIILIYSEANGSFIIEGIIKFLIGNSIVAIKLRNSYLFKIIPMLNPDGVIIGNYRCSLAGHDLNRQWIDPKKNNFPEIFAAKNVNF